MMLHSRQFFEVRLTLNKKMCESDKKSITFFGFVFSEQRISPVPKKVEAIKNAKPPTMTMQWCERLLGNGHVLCEVHPKFQ